MEKYRQDTTITEQDGSRHRLVYSLDGSWDTEDTLHPIPNGPWLASRDNPYADMETELLERYFIKMLTEKQRTVYRLHFKLGLTAAECAAHNRTSVRNVEKLIAAIRKKAKIFF